VELLFIDLIQIHKLVVQISTNYSTINSKKKLLKVHFLATGVLVTLAPQRKIDFSEGKTLVQIGTNYSTINGHEKI